jgi:hypothetical protein
MGQYFQAVNLDKKECVCPWCLSGGAKLFEWAANTQGAIFTLLLRCSDEGGGGDYFGYHRGYDEGSAVPEHEIAGRWAGDRVVLIGDYDSSKLWDKLPRYRNISKEVVETWNDFIEIPELKLTYRECSCHAPRRAAA